MPSASTDKLLQGTAAEHVDEVEDAATFAEQFVHFLVVDIGNRDM